MDYITGVLASPEVQNALIALFGLLLTFILNRAAGAFQLWTGIRIEEKHMLSLHQAVITAVESGLQQGPARGLEAMRAHVLDYLHQSVPDALKALTPDDGVLDRLIERYTHEALNRIGEATVPSRP